MEEPELLKKFACTTPALVATKRLRLENRKQVLFAREPLEDTRLLREVAHAGERVAVHRLERHVATVKLDDARLGGDHSHRHAERRGLACAITTKQPHHFTRVQLESNSVDDAASGVGLRESGGRKERHPRSVALARRRAGRVTRQRTRPR